MPSRLPILPSGDDPAILISEDYVIQAANEAYVRHYGQDVTVGRKRCFEVSHGYRSPCDDNGELCPLRQTLRTKQRTRVFHVHHSPDGPEHVDVALSPVLDDDGEVVGFIEVIRPIEAMSAQVSGTFVGRSRAFQRLVELIHRAAPSDVPVLLLGESGAGKELAARAVHAASPRRDGPFVPVECSGLSESLFESELFGHAKGAFTGAHRDREGLVEAAAGGTLFLDEVGDVPLSLQVKLLRLVESGTFRRVGESEPRRAEFRLVLATHRALPKMIEAGTFREDLFYRINVFPVPLPPLRARREDIPLIADALLGERDKVLHPDAAEALASYDFPGNVRELKNVLERAVLLSDDREIRAEHLLPPARVKATEGAWPWGEAILPFEEVERRYLAWAAANHDGDRRALAEKLGMSARTLYRKLSR